MSGTLDFFQTLAAWLVPAFRLNDAMNSVQKGCRIIDLVEHVQGIDDIGAAIRNGSRLVAQQYRRHIGQAIPIDFSLDQIDGQGVDIGRIDTAIRPHLACCLADIAARSALPDPTACEASPF